MSIDGKLLRQSLDRLDAEKKARSAKDAGARARAYAKYPRIKEIDLALRASMLDVIGSVAGGGDVDAKIDAAKKKNKTIYILNF